MSNLQVGAINSTTGNVTNVGSNTVSKTDLSFADTYDEAILRANALDVNLLAYVSETGEIPKYVVPYDLSHSTDYTTTLATPERLATTDYYNSLFGFGERVAKPEIVSNTTGSHEDAVAASLAKTTQNISAQSNISASLPVKNVAFVSSDVSSPEVVDAMSANAKFTDAKSAVQNWRSAKASLSYMQYVGVANDMLRTT